MSDYLIIAVDDKIIARGITEATLAIHLDRHVYCVITCSEKNLEYEINELKKRYNIDKVDIKY